MKGNSQRDKATKNQGGQEDNFTKRQRDKNQGGGQEGTSPCDNATKIREGRKESNKRRGLMKRVSYVCIQTLSLSIVRCILQRDKARRAMIWPKKAIAGTISSQELFQYSNHRKPFPHIAQHLKLYNQMNDKHEKCKLPVSDIIYAEQENNVQQSNSFSRIATVIHEMRTRK